MTPAMLAAVLALGVSSGWEKLPDGGYEYILQIEPRAVEALKEGDVLTSDLSPKMRGIRSFRIQVGTGPVPKIGNPEEPETPPATVLQTANQVPQSPPSDAFPKSPPDAATAVTPATSEGAQPSKPAPAPSNSAAAADATPAPRWMPLTLAVAGLLASVGGNLYLGWMIWEIRGRYRQLLHRAHGSTAT